MLKIFIKTIFIIIISSAYSFVNAQQRFDIVNSGSSAWNPATLSITVGDTVVWTNTGGTHNVNGTTATYPSNPESFGGFTPAGPAASSWPFVHVFTLPGNYTYRCDPHAGSMIGTITVMAAPPAPCSELFFSEYVEGSSNNKAVEIYNPRKTAVNLSGYTVTSIVNGGTSINTFNMVGMLAPNSVYIFAADQADPAILAVADTVFSFPSVAHFNGDDALIFLNPLGDTIDIIGTPGVDPGTNWDILGTNGVSGSTNEFTLVRDSLVSTGDLTYWNMGTNMDEGPNGQWKVYPQNSFQFLGTHTAVACQAAIIPPCTELFFSEYVEGTSNNKAVEIYNPTDNPVNLTGYTVSYISNGGPTTNTFNMVGTLGSKQTYVFAADQADPAILAIADTTFSFPSVAHFNGDDALLLINPLGDTVDIIGTPNDDPGTNWDVLGTNNVMGATNEFTLVRDPQIGAGNLTYWNMGPNMDQGPTGEWIVYPQNSFQFLGSHISSACQSPIVTGAFQLQLLHASDLEGGVEALGRATNFASIIDTLEGTYPNTVVISSGDNYIPGPFFNAAGDFTTRNALKYVYQNGLGLPSGNNDIREGNGRIDISIMNVIGFDASAIGNHEWDAGSSIFADLVRPDIRTGPQARWLGAQFPYLSANLDFSGDATLFGIYTDSIRPNTDFRSDVNNLTSAAAAPRLAPSTYITRNGEKIGVIGATTQFLEQISSPGNVSVIGGGSNDMVQLAGLLQPYINDLIFNEGVNKVIVTTHLQQFALEQQLIGLLSGVDIVIAGGSDFLLANPSNTLQPGDVAQGTYPFFTVNADGDTAVIISTDGQYKYVGRLVVDFDSLGKIVPSSIDANLSGAYASTNAVVSSLWGSVDPLAIGTKGHYVDTLISAVESVVIAKDGNVLGKTNVYLEGRRAQVRTEETNLGNLSADANLAFAQNEFDPTVLVSIKNGGGIRAEIGEVRETSPGVYQFLPPQPNPVSGKDSLEVSQLDVENSLRFNNRLSVLELSATDLKAIVEHGVAASNPGQTPGQFPQVGGVYFKYNLNYTPGNRVREMIIRDINTNADIDTIVLDGVVYGNPAREIKTVTLNFLAGGGDSYPFPALGQNRFDLDTVAAIASDTGAVNFAIPGSEQDALAEYFKANFQVNPYNQPETSILNDTRIVLDTTQIPVIIPTYNIGTIRGNDNLGGSVNVGLADSLGVTCRVFAIVTTPDIGGSNRSVTLQDATGAISIFQPGSTTPPVLNVGDSVEIVGTIGSFNGLSQFVNSTTINVISTGNALPTPLLVDSLGEFTESRLIRMNDMRFVDPTIWTSSAGGGSFNIQITNGIDTFVMRVDSDLPLASQVTPPAAPFDVVGFGGQFDQSDPFTSGYQIFAIDSANFFPSAGPAIPTYTIGDVTVNNATGVADSIGTVCKLVGIAYGENFRAGLNGLEFTLIDENNTNEGIAVFASSTLGYTLNEGDELRVIGTVDQVFGLTRISADSIVVLSGGNALKAADVVTTLAENTESDLVVFTGQYIPEGTWTGTGSSFSVRFTNGTDTITVRIDNDCDLYSATEPLSAPNSYEVRGIGGQFDLTAPFDADYVLLPRRATDLTLLVGLSNSSLAGGLSVYPNPARNTVTIDGLSGNSVIELMDLMGRTVKEVNTSNKKMEFNISNLAKGQYILRVSDNNEVSSVKLVISE